MARVEGGAKLENALIQLARRVGKKRTLKVGFLEDSTYPDGTPVALVAAVQNYGSPKLGIPPRPFMTNTVKANSQNWPKQIAAILKNTKDIDVTMNLMGELIKGQMQDEIVKIVAPPLSPVTIMLRKMKSANPGLKVTWAVLADARARVKAGESVAGVSTKPLIDMGFMLFSVDYVVE